MPQPCYWPKANANDYIRNMNKTYPSKVLVLALAPPDFQIFRRPDFRLNLDPDQFRKIETTAT